jgi:uncharacterized membrane protein YoaK (UPF0700 family)
VPTGSIGAVTTSGGMPRSVQLSGPLWVAAALALTAGYLDAHVYQHVAEVFVANMSGSLVLLGIGVVDGEASTNLAFVAVIVAFVLGAALAHLVHARRRAEGRPLRPALLVAVEAALVVAAAVWLLATDLPPAGPGTPWEAFPVLVVLAFAMGLQNAVVLAVGSVAVATTYETGSIDRLGRAAAEVLVSATADRRTQRQVVGVLATVVLTYVVGAALGAAAGSSPMWLLAALAPLAAVASRVAPRRPRP